MFASLQSHTRIRRPGVRVKQRGDNVQVVSVSRIMEGLNELNYKTRMSSNDGYSTRHRNERRGIVPPATTASRRSRSNVVNNNSPL